MQIELEREISLCDRFFRGKLLKNERCVKPLIVAMGFKGTVSYKPSPFR